ncbi:hypothetical protein Tco_0730549 [Tanacetum coccineum]|uniref:Gag-Pol polyprotein n=1 Tax=Tanacetum coccineum TaxID=301880 RepID=A0ABQ4YS33_9ASTR
MQQPVPNPEDIIDLTTTMNMTLVLMAKAFKLNYSTPTNNNQIISSNPHNRQIAQPGMNLGQDRQMQMVGGNGGNQFRHSESGVQNIRNQNGLIVVSGIANPNANQIGNDNVVAARAKSNANGNNSNQIRWIQLQVEEFDFMAAVEDLEEIEEVNANCILMANLQQASTSGIQIDNAPVYDSDGSAKVHHSKNCYDNDIFNKFTQEEQYTELLKLISEPHQVQQNDSNVIFTVSSVEQCGETVEQNPATVEEIYSLTTTTCTISTITSTFTPTHTSPTYDEAPLGYRAAGIWLRTASPPTHHPLEIPSLPLLLPSTTHRDDLPEADMPLRKRVRFTASASGFEVRESSSAAAARQPGLDVAIVDETPGRHMSREVGYGIEDVWDDMVGDMEERAPTIVEGFSQRVTDLSTTLARDTHEIYIRLEDA